jgi:hypothetical protein
MLGSAANAAVLPTVPLATAGNYSVLGASTVTNTGPSTLRLNLGLSPGTSITGFPPGLVIPPANINRTNAVAAQAQSDLTTAYINAHGRSLDATTPANLANKHLQAGVYAGPSKGALQLTGPLVLDGAGDPTSVFIFQTDSTLITASGSTVSLINGAQACNVFWQVGSSATLGSGSVFAGNILALTSITVNSSVTVHGRALARSGAVTLINDTFVKPTCALGTGGGTPTTTPAGSSPTTTPAAGGGTPAPGTPGTPGTPGAATPGDSGGGSGGPGIPPVIGPPRTGAVPLATGGFPWPGVLLAALVGAVGGAGAMCAVGVRHRRVLVRAWRR